jgi:DnaJ-class molecular chaperone
MTWHRPTQEFGSSNNFFNILWNNALNDKFNFFKHEKSTHSLNGKKLSPKDIDAFKIMELELNTSWPNIQKKFKTLVKKFHPDKNSGNKQFEDKLKRITLAYSHLKMIMIKK